MSRAALTPGGSPVEDITAVYSSCLAQFSTAEIPRSYMNKLVLDFFSEEGYYLPWTSLSLEIRQESGAEGAEALAPAHPSVVFLRERSEIRALIMDGRLSDAISRINDLNPMVLEQAPDVHFSLLQHKILEHMHAAPEEDILELIKRELSPLVLNIPLLVPRLEDTLLQYVFRSSADIITLRRKLAKFVNKSILLAFRIQPKQELLKLIGEGLELQESIPTNYPLKPIVLPAAGDY